MLSITIIVLLTIYLMKARYDYTELKATCSNLERQIKHLKGGR